jgi:hypothetical protein
MEIKLPDVGIGIAKERVSRHQVGQLLRGEVRDREGVALLEDCQGLARKFEKG